MPSSTVGVQTAVRLAAEAGPYPAIRGGGHNAAGLAMVDDGLVIDLSDMNGILVESGTRMVTAKTGQVLAELMPTQCAHEKEPQCGDMVHDRSWR